MKNYTIKAPRIKRQHLTIGPFLLRVQCSNLLPVPWRQLKPLIASAWRHITREAVRQGSVLFAPRLTLTNGNSWRGRAWPGARQTLVRLADLHTEPRPTRYPRYQDMPEFWHANWQEHLVGLCAHELWHLYSRKPSGREQEFECELVESDAIDVYRRLSSPETHCTIKEKGIIKS